MWKLSEFVNILPLTLINKINGPIIGRMTGVFSLTCLISACGVGGLGSSDDEGSGPIISNSPVAFIKRPLLFDEDDENELAVDDLRIPQTFRPGARLYVKNNASPDTRAKDVTSGLFNGAYDVRDLSVSPDGEEIVFAMRAPELEDVDPEFQPKWNLWLYNFDADRLTKLMSDDTAEAGHDISPAFLPSGKIVFASTRQQTSKAILLDEGKSQYAATEEDRLDDEEGDRQVETFVLHVTNRAGTEIEQITFNQSHDLNPIVLDNGKVLFTRWDNAARTANNGMNLYEVNPDGSGLNYLYGRHSHDSPDSDDPIHFVNPIEAPDGDIIVQLRAFESQSLSAKPVKINVSDYIESDQQTNTAGGSAQQSVVSGISVSDEPDLDGQYGSIFPLYDGTGRYLASWSICRIRRDSDAEIEVCTQEKLDSGDYEAAPPAYGLWIVNGDTQLPIELPEEGQVFEDAVVVVDRPAADLIEDLVPATDELRDLADEGFGVIHIRSVYDFDGVDTSAAGIDALADPVQTAPENRPAQFLRLVKPVSIPGERVLDFDIGVSFGRDRSQSMREILGYVPIEPDGSVKVAVPANVAFGLSILDADGRRTSPRHDNWISVRPGETLDCKGCHTGTSEVPHGRRNAGVDTINDGALAFGPFANSEPDLIANAGETMAETYAAANGIRRLSSDIVYTDEWTDPAVVAKAADFSYAYADLSSNSPVLADSVCDDSWDSVCRLIINYQEHIHPLWSVDRRIFDVDEVTVLEDRTCTSCHNDEDDMAVTMVPAGQLDLSEGSSDQEAAQFKSYRELLFNDNEQELNGGVLQDVQVDTGEFERDEDGELILDAEDNPIPILAPVNVNPVMRVAGANSSDDFFDVFEGGAHDGYLTTVELKLISEWLDIGAQYWNDPYLAPED